MKTYILIILSFFVFATICLAQQNDPPSVEKTSGNLILKSGSKITGTLQDTLDVEKTKNSDDFVLKLSEEVKGGGIVIEKGTELLGRVVRVKSISEGDNVSEISLFFDFVKLEDDFLSLKASITSITEEAGDGNKASPFKIDSSTNFKGATVISIKGKNLVINSGSTFQLKLEMDLVKP